MGVNQIYFNGLGFFHLPFLSVRFPCNFTRIWIFVLLDRNLGKWNAILTFEVPRQPAKCHNCLFFSLSVGTWTIFESNVALFFSYYYLNNFSIIFSAIDSRCLHQAALVSTVSDVLDVSYWEPLLIKAFEWVLWLSTEKVDNKHFLISSPDIGMRDQRSFYRCRLYGVHVQIWFNSRKIQRRS